MRKCFYATFALALILHFAPARLSGQDTDQDRKSIQTLLALVPELTAGERSVLEGTGEASVSRVLAKNGPPSLVPRILLREPILSTFRNFKSDFGVETLMVARIPGTVPEAEDFTRTLYEVLLSVSTMEGIQYYSESRNRDRLLFETSYRIRGPGDRTRLPDPVPERIPDSRSIHILQKDLTFGENLYRVDYEAIPDAIRLTMENITTMKYGILTAVRPGNMRTSFLILRDGNHLLFYGVSTAASSLPLLESRSRISFQNRIEAIFGWFTERLAEELPR